MFKKSICGVLILSVSAAILAGIVALVLYVAQTSRDMALGLEEQAMTRFAEQTAKTLSNHLDALRSQAQSLAGMEVMRAAVEWGEGRQAQAVLTAVLKNQEGIWSALAFDTEGKVVAGCNADGGDLTGGDRKDRDYAQAILGGRDAFVSPRVITAKSGGGNMLICSVAAAVRDKQGNIIGGVGLFPRWSAFTATFLDPVRFGDRGYPFMLDGKGRIIAHATDPGLLLKDFSDQGFAKTALGLDRGSVSYDWKGDRKFMAVQDRKSVG